LRFSKTGYFLVIAASVNAFVPWTPRIGRSRKKCLAINGYFSAL